MLVRWRVSWACDSKWRTDVVVLCVLLPADLESSDKITEGMKGEKDRCGCLSFMSTMLSFTVWICWRCNCTSSFQLIYSVRSLRGIPLRFSVISATNGNIGYTRTLEKVSGRFMDVYEFIFSKSNSREFQKKLYKDEGPLLLKLFSAIYSTLSEI